MNSSEAVKAAQDLLPAALKHDPYWLSMITILVGTPGLTAIMDRYLDFDTRSVNVVKFNREVAGYLSTGERILAALALHLFNSFNRLPKEGLSDLGMLDEYHLDLAITAIRVRFGHYQ